MTADILIIINRIPKVTKITNIYFYHLAMTRSTRASRRRAAIIAPPSPELAKAYRSMTSANDENCRSEGTNL
jgi:hypothetical protein